MVGLGATWNTVGVTWSSMSAARRLWLLHGAVWVLHGGLWGTHVDAGCCMRHIHGGASWWWLAAWCCRMVWVLVGGAGCYMGQFVCPIHEGYRCHIRGAGCYMQESGCSTLGFGC